VGSSAVMERLKGSLVPNDNSPIILQTDLLAVFNGMHSRIELLYYQMNKYIHWPAVSEITLSSHFCPDLTTPAQSDA
jgi:hypothetical protein